MKYSIIIPAYNVEKYIEGCLRRLMRWGRSDIEIIVIDDGSTDSTYDILKKAKKEHHKIRVYHQENMGLAGARRAGVEKASGKYCLMLDADDWLGDNAIEIIDSYINEFKDIDVLKFRFIYEPFGKCGAEYKPCGKILDNEELSILYRDLLLTNKYNNLCNQVFKKELYEEVNIGTDERINYGEDILVNLDIIGRAKSVFFANDALYHYVENPDSITHKITLEKIVENISDFIVVSKKRIDFLKNNGVKNVSIDMVKTRLVSMVCSQIKLYVLGGGKIDSNFERIIRKSGFYDFWGDSKLVGLRGVDFIIAKHVLRKQYRCLGWIKPYVMCRAGARKVYLYLLRFYRKFNRH